MENVKSKENEKAKKINPTEEKGNYVIQIIADGKVLKQVIALGSTVNIISIGEQPMAAEIR